MKRAKPVPALPGYALTRKEDAATMKLKTRGILTMVLLLAVLTLVTGCSQEPTPYEINDAENFTVSVRYDANGGTFTTNTSVIVDSYDPAQAAVGENGMARIALLPPDASVRGNDAFAAVTNGYFLAGWYQERTEQPDGTYTYSGKWDFESDLLEVDPAGDYSSAEPVMTLYAAWIPMFRIDFCDLESGEVLDSYTFDPNIGANLTVPALNEETGAMEMYKFPARSGYTFSAAYYDAEGTQMVDTPEVIHTGAVNYENGTAENSAMNLYIDWTEGEWYHIYNVEQFLDNASVSGNYVLHADLDFAGEIWPTSLMYGNFSGTIQGNGHTLRNIELTQTNNSKVNAGLFGHLTETAGLTDVIFENVTFTIQAGTRVVGTNYGLLAGTISTDALLENVSITDSCLQIDSSCYFGVEEYAIGLVCGMGDPGRVSAEISCQVVGDAPERITTAVEGNEITLEFVS